MNELCDESGVEKAAVILVSAFNFSDRFSQEGAPPVGGVSARGKVFDGDSGLIVKQKSKNRTGSNGTSKGIRLTTKVVNGTFTALLKVMTKNRADWSPR